MQIYFTSRSFDRSVQCSEYSDSCWTYRIYYNLYIIIVLEFILCCSFCPFSAPLGPSGSHHYWSAAAALGSSPWCCHRNALGRSLQPAIPYSRFTFVFACPRATNRVKVRFMYAIQQKSVHTSVVSEGSASLATVCLTGALTSLSEKNVTPLRSNTNPVLQL